MSKRKLIYTACLLLFCTLELAAQNHSNTFESNQYKTRTDNSVDAKLLLKEARELYSLKQVTSAIIKYQEVLKLEPNNYVAKTELGTIALESNNWAYAIKLYSELAKTDPNNEQIRKVLIAIHHSFGESTKELKFVYELVKHNSQDTVLLKSLVELYDEHGMYVEQGQVLKQLLALEPENQQYLFDLSQIYSNTGRIRREFSTYNKLTNLNTRQVGYLKRIARRYGDLGKYGMQINLYDYIKSIDNDSSDWHMALLDTYTKALKSYDFYFDVRKAIKDYETYLQGEPKQEEYHNTYRALKQLKKPLFESRSHFRAYEFIEKTKAFSQLLRVNLLGPIDGSRLSFQNNYLQTRFSKDQIAHTNAMSATWHQTFQNFNAHLEIGLNKPLAELNHLDPKFMAKAGINYDINPNLNILADYELKYVDDNPLVTEQQISVNKFDVSVFYMYQEKLHLSLYSEQSYFSDSNSSTNILLDFNYDILRTLFENTNLEQKQPIGYDQFGMVLNAGIQYNYMDFKEVRTYYPTVTNENIFTASIAFKKQLINSLFFSCRGFREIGMEETYIWGYSANIEYYINWLYTLYVEYEDFNSRYVFDGQKFNNHESGLHFGLALRF
jgi:tetratricopeptide (TPR) repeat protein